LHGRLSISLATTQVGSKPLLRYVSGKERKKKKKKKKKEEEEESIQGFPLKGKGSC